MTQVYDIDQDDDANRRNAEEQVEKKFRKPLYGYTFPPRADVCFEGKYWLILHQGVDHMAQLPTIYYGRFAYRNRKSSGPGENSHREDGILIG